MEGITDEADDFPSVFDDDDDAARSSANCDDALRTDSGVATNDHFRAPAGRSVGVCWEFLSTELNQQLQLQTRCMSCLMMVKHHKKSERVKAHLNACIPFRRSMADMASSDVPDWVVPGAGVNTQHKRRLVDEAHHQRVSPPYLS